MKRIIDVILLILFLFIVCVLYFQYDYSNELKKQINQRDTIIASYQKLDSVYETTIQKYVDTVEKYIIPEFLYGNKRISVEELLDGANSSIRELHKIKYELAMARDSIKYYKIYSHEVDTLNKKLYKYYDSTFIYRGYSNIAKAKYGIVFLHTKDSNNYTFYANSKQLDSALILLPYFRDRLKYDPEKETWEIRIRKGLFDK